MAVMVPMRISARIDGSVLAILGRTWPGVVLDTFRRGGPRRYGAIVEAGFPMPPTPLHSCADSPIKGWNSRGLQAATAVSHEQDVPHGITWKLLLADGRTARRGIVRAIKTYGAVVKLAEGCCGLLPTGGSGAASQADIAYLKRDDIVTVYVVGKRNDTGKLQLSLVPREEPLTPLHYLVADGRNPYVGTVEDIVDWGIFVNIGCEAKGLLTAASIPKGMQFQRGNQVTVYVTAKDCKRSRIMLALTPLASARHFWSDVCIDGQTPYEGTVVDVDKQSLCVDIGRSSPGVLPRNQDGGRAQYLTIGRKVVVYVVGKDQAGQRLKLSLVPRARPLIPWDQIVADEQTPYRGIVVRWADAANAGCIVDIGCEKDAFLPATDALVASGKLKKGDEVTVYISRKSSGQSPMTASSKRRAIPRERLSALLADGVTPYVGTVLGFTQPGVFFDIGSEVAVFMSACNVQDWSKVPKVGGQVPVYVWNTNPEVGKVYVRVDPRDQPALAFADILADGVTPYDGTLFRKSSAGAFVDIGCERAALIKRHDTCVDATAISALAEGARVRVYAIRKNPVTRSISLALNPSERRRIRFDEVQGGGVATFDGSVARIMYDVIFVDFHCEVSGCAQRAIDCSLQVGDRVRVRPLTFDKEKGRWVVALVTAFRDDAALTSTSCTANVAPSGSQGAISSEANPTRPMAAAAIVSDEAVFAATPFASASLTESRPPGRTEHAHAPGDQLTRNKRSDGKLGASGSHAD